MKTNTYNKIVNIANTKKGFFCLIDPDKLSAYEASKRAELCNKNGVDAILVGGSLMLNNNFEQTLIELKKTVDIPVIIFPGIFNFVSKYADALLLLSMVSSRNPQMLIGEQVRAAPLIKKHNLEAIGTAYMIVESGPLTSVQYMSYSLPLPHAKPDIAVAHALAAQYLGMKLIYLDGGSGAAKPVSNKMLTAVKQNCSLPIILGGGINTPELAAEKIKAGADIIVTGTALEENFCPDKLKRFADSVHGAI